MKTVVLAIHLVLPMLLMAQSITYTEHIAPIIYENCTSCHRTGEIGPMALNSYETVKDWSRMIARVTQDRYMPPWKADPNYSTFLGQRSLSEEDIQLIQQWVENGSPQGDPALEPSLPQFPEGSQVGDPDIVLPFERSFLHKGGNVDEYRVFVFPLNLDEDLEVSAIELRPGNSEIVHHAIFTTDLSGRALKQDLESEVYGYESFGGFGRARVGQFIDGYVPGQIARLAPSETGFIIPAGADLLVQMHYAPAPFEQYDSSTINIFLKKEEVRRPILQEILYPDPEVINELFLIRANTVKSFHGKWFIEDPISLLSITPHMHLLGRSWRVFATSAEGDTTQIISITDWDFNWQNTYHFDRLIPIPSGSTIHAIATYDNTTDNPYNPNVPPRNMTWGEGTRDEMYFLPINFLDYQPGDEAIVFADQLTNTDEQPNLIRPQNKIENLYPNPINDALTVEFTLADAQEIRWEITDLQGKKTQTSAGTSWYSSGANSVEIRVQDLPTGLYVLQFIGQTNLSRKFEIVR